jgi:subtilisin family serine protease
VKVHHRILSAIFALSLLVSMVTPALAQTPWPSGRGGASPGAGTVQTPTFTPVTNAGARPFTRVSPEEAAQLAGQLPARDWSAPRGATLPSAGTQPAAAAFAAQGDQVINVVAHLEMPSLLQGVSASADGAARAAYAEALAAEQARVATDITALGGRVVFTFSTLSSGIAVQVPATQAAGLAAIPGVSHVSQVRDYTRDLAETVSFIGAQFLQDIGVKGAGVKVAVLDSGIDFSHLAFGGPGTVAGWEAAYFGADPACDPNAWHNADCAYAKPANPALFGPAALRVKGGFDWLGEEWPNGLGRILPDPNPIDIEGHGTHVADIIGGLGYAAGVNADGPYPAKGVGVAPGVALYGFKVCASFSTSCNGLALLKAMDNAADLDGNPTTFDPADVINMSLGSSYGQPEDDLTFFTNQAAALGIIVVASAGNSANKPYIVGSPSIADGAISVAQTTVPSATRYPLFYASSAVTGTIGNAVWQNWSTAPAPVLVQGAVAYGNADGSNRDGCVAYTDNMAGRVVLADRGVCSFTLKAKNASDAGAVISLIGLVAPGDPFEGGDGGHRPINIPSFMIDQATSSLLKAQLANGVIAGIDPADAINLANTMVGSSSRGPRNHDGVIKPDIGAPGASVSAIAGGGAASAPFGGTSGAAPIVSGVAALLRGVYGDSLTPQQYKALLMNTGDSVYNDVPRNSLAPVTRSGGGQVNARAAYYSKLIAWDSTDETAPLSWTGSISFGYVPASEYQAYTRTLTIQNLGPLGQAIEVSSWFRAAEDAGQGVFVTPLVKSVLVPAGGSVEVPVLLEIFPAGDDESGLVPLHPWGVNRGSLGADGLSLQFQEYDGFVLIESQSNDPIHVVWQVLPKAAAEIAVNATSLTAGTGVLVNASPGVEGATDIFSLVEVDGNDYNYVVGDCTSIDLPPGCNQSPVDIHEVGVRAYTGTVPYDLLEFAVTIWDEPYRAGQYPPEIDIYIDSDADGTDDYVIFNGDLARDGSDGRTIVFLADLATNAVAPWYFIDATFNSQNFILPMDAAAIGVTPGQPFRFSVFTFDAYFTGDLWDCAPKVDEVCTGAWQYTPGVARYDVPEAQLFPTVPAGGSEAFSWTTSAAATLASPDQIGLLFMHRNAHVGRESDHIVFTDTYLPIIKK